MNWGAGGVGGGGGGGGAPPPPTPHLSPLIEMILEEHTQ